VGGPLKTQLTRAFLRASGLPSLDPVVLDPADDVRFAAAADDLLERAERPPPDIPLVRLLRWLAQERGVLFHGSLRDNLTILEPIRHTRDSAPFGDQKAVFAASDPVWAIYFATLRRGDGFRSTRNGSFGLPGVLYPRWYFFSHNEEAERDRRFGDGWLYVLPRESFEPEPPTFGIDPGQWASLASVTPLVRLPVTAADFPFADRVFSHRIGEPMWRTYLRATRFGRRYRTSRRAESSRSRSPSSV
jgi:hypothetical protein